MEQILTTMSLN